MMHLTTAWFLAMSLIAELFGQLLFSAGFGEALKLCPAIFLNRLPDSLDQQILKCR